MFCYEQSLLCYLDDMSVYVLAGPNPIRDTIYKYLWQPGLMGLRVKFSLYISFINSGNSKRHLSSQPSNILSPLHFQDLKTISFVIYIYGNFQERNSPYGLVWTRNGIYIQISPFLYKYRYRYVNLYLLLPCLQKYSAIHSQVCRITMLHYIYCSMTHVYDAACQLFLQRRFHDTFLRGSFYFQQ